MLEHDHSAARGKMTARKLFVFKHDSLLGNAPAHKLFELIEVKPTHDPAAPARAFTDYQVTVQRDQLAAKVELIEKL
jgi:CRISPR-associated protein Csd2